MTTLELPTGIYRAVADVINERLRQERLFPDQHLPLGTDSTYWGIVEQAAKDDCYMGAVNGSLTWADVLREEVYEALATTEVEDTRREMIEVAAVALRIVEDIDSR